MSRYLLGYRVAAAIVLGLVMVGCGSSDEDADKGPVARIHEFTVDSDTVLEGETTTLRWSTQRATSVFLSENGIKVHPGSLPEDGTWEISPTRDSTYRLEARGKDGVAIHTTASVEVEPFGPPRIDSFTASPERAGSGAPVTLRWSVARADSVEIALTNGGSLGEFSPAQGEGSLEVRPTTATIYMLRARNAAGMSTAQVAVEVSGRPSLELQLSSTQVSFGEEVLLAWTVAEAETLAIVDPTGAVIHEGPAADGELSLIAEEAGTYRATAIGIGGELGASAHLSIQPRIADFRVSAHGELRPGEAALASWSVLGAERIVISNGIEDIIESRGGEGQQTVPLSTGGNFTLRAYSGSLVSTESTNVEVQEVPLIRRVSTGQLVTAGQGVAGISTIGWEIDGAARITMEVEPGGLVDLTGKSPRMDEVEVRFMEAGTITLTATNNAGSTSVQFPAPVDPVPFIDQLYAAPSRAGSGEAVEIHWATTFAEQVILEQDGAVLGDATSDPNSHHLTANLAAGSSFVLRAFNSLGHEVVSDPLVVEIGSPNQLAFDTEDGLRLYGINSTVNLVWENDGGTNLRVTWDGDIVCETQVWTEIRQGGCPFTMPDAQQDVELVIEVENNLGSDSRTLNLQAVTGPIIVSFTADTPSITEGDSLVFSWEVLPDNEGGIPELTLEDEFGNHYDLSDIKGTDALLGSKRHWVDGWHDTPRTFILTAATDVDPPYALSTQVMVYGIPVVESMGAHPPFALDEGDQVTVSWETDCGESDTSYDEGATSCSNHEGMKLSLYGLAENGEVESAPFFSDSDLSTALSGSASFLPTIPFPHVRLVVENPRGVETSADFRVGVSPATISSFTANGIEAPAAIDVLFGDEVTVAWETARTTETLYQEGFIDISQRPNAIEFPLSGSDTVTNIVETLIFPDGFTFPYDGEEFNFIRVGISGWMTFDPTVTSLGNVALPSTTASHQARDLFPFWDLMNKRPEPAEGKPDTGTMWWEYIEGDVDQIVIQWKNMNVSATAGRAADLTFQAVLFEDGTFEYRYGTMKGQANHEKGVGATIAAQNRAGSEANVLSHNTAWQPGLEGQVFRFHSWDGFVEAASTPIPTPLDGSVTFRPKLSRTYQLTARNGHSEHTEELEIRVHPKGHLDVWTEPAEPLPGEAVSLHWSGTNLTAISILDAGGTQVHEASAAELEAGAIPLGALPQGIHWYTVKAEGMVAWNQIEEEIPVSVNDTFSLDSFTVSEGFVKPGELPVTLSWETTNATSAKIIELPGGAETAIGAGDLASGSMQVSPSTTTTYVLEVESHERYREAEAEVVVRTVWIDDFSASATVIPAGSTIDLSWNGSPDGSVSVDGPGVPFNAFLEEGEPFQDISGVGTALTTGSGGASSYHDVTLPSGFTFPFYGQNYTSFRVAGTGMITFNTGFGTWKYNNTTLPNTGEPDIHIAPFWEDLQASSLAGAGIWTHLVTGPDPHFIIQWTHWKPWSSSITGDLNFQAVLYASGEVEYRYGAMTSSNGAAQGGGITIGLQEPGGEEGSLLHFGSTDAAHYPGGLANRSFRWEPPIDIPNSFTVPVKPPYTTEYEVCIEDEFHRECHTVEIAVITPGSLVISEAMAMPSGGGAEWLEIRNLLGIPLDLEGFSLSNGSSAYEITGSLMVPPGGFAVLAGQSDPNLEADHLYSGWSFGGPSGEVALEFQGAEIHSLSWDSATSGVSLQLPGGFQYPGTSPVGSAELCSSNHSYDGGASMGTPGTISDCATHGYVVDYYSQMPFIDIREVGSRSGYLNADTASSYLTNGIGFSFPFFGGTQDELWMNSNGLIGFGNSNATNTDANRDLMGSGSPSTGIVAGFWDDLTVSDDLQSWVGFHQPTIDGLRVQIVQYDGVKRKDQAGSITFQIQLWENGDIVIVFADIEGSEYYFGADATIGIEAPGGSPALQYLHRSPVLNRNQSLYFKKLP